MRMTGEVMHVIDMYESEMLKESMEQRAAECNNPLKEKYGLEMHLGKIETMKCSSETINTFDDFTVDIEYELFDDLSGDPLLGVAFYTIDRQYIFGPNTYLDGVQIPNTKGIHHVRYIV